MIAHDAPGPTALEGVPVFQATQEPHAALTQALDQISVVSLCACPAKLKDYLATLPRTGKHILAKNLTQPFSKRRVQKLVMDVRKQIGATEFVIHGWRYNAAVELAEAGCSDTEIQAVTGHKTLAMVQKYRAQANQKRLSKSAQAKRTEQKRNEKR
ncbi:hypothetical protein DS909_09240 [Phaeobacter gallaeciensis]|uniref:Tyr recombinase domain-containing protein n=1 Tax=Phaeobacter gallaeciensis TaxID=60890 RepID=A0A366X2L4_9RHOB|nr:hypothetical protein DS909_09240 [Phaeobacter gallaeciensis]